MLATTVTPVKRLAFVIPLVVGSAAFALAEAARDVVETRIPHLDGTGTATVIEVHPSLPGAAEFLRATPGPIPHPGEIILPASATPGSSPSPSPTPRAPLGRR